MREIGRQLGVAYIMEGSVQRARDRLRINATLIDARTDAHIWAETYDRTAADLFAIQSELAQSIVTQLKAKLSPKQKAEIEERPTQDLVAFELYLQAKAIIDSYINATDVRAALLQALKSLDEAIQRDPNFVSAYCYAARANDLLFFFDLDPTPERISLADAAVKTALRLRPDSAEAHFALADYLFRCLRDYDRALEELAIARPGLPNSTPFFILSGYINRRRNHFHEAERDFSTAFALDPRNPNAYNLLADTFVLQRRFPEAVHVSDNVLAAGEQTPIVRFRRASSILSVDRRHSDRSARFWQNFRTWNLPAAKRRPASGWQCWTATTPKRNGCSLTRLFKIFKTSTSAFIFRRAGIKQWSPARKAIQHVQWLRFASVEKFWSSD